MLVPVPNALAATLVFLTSAAVLVLEILSPATRRADLTLKRSRYEAAGIATYWVVDPDVPSVTGWQLREGRYVDAAHAEGDEVFEVSTPFAVRLRPGDLLT